MARISTRQMAERIAAATGRDVKEWQVRRLFESGLLPEPERFVGRRMLDASDFRRIITALQLKGWLPDEVVCA